MKKNPKDLTELVNNEIDARDAIDNARRAQNEFNAKVNDKWLRSPVGLGLTLGIVLYAAGCLYFSHSVSRLGSQGVAYCKKCDLNADGRKDMVVYNWRYEEFRKITSIWLQQEDGTYKHSDLCSYDLEKIEEKIEEAERLAD